MDIVADQSHSGTLELIVIRVPVLGETGLGFKPDSGFLRIYAVEAALGLKPMLLLPPLELLRPLLYLSKAAAEDNEETKAKREQRIRVSHCGTLLKLLLW